MEGKTPVAGQPQPVFVAGVRYKSFFEASIEADISTVWMLKMLKSSGGYPVVIKRMMVATECWFFSRLNAMGEP